MASETSTNLWHADVAMKSKSARTSNCSQRNKRKTNFNKTKVCFADNLETVHEIPNNFYIFKKGKHGLELPEIKAHKYTPLAFRDPYAKPSKRKKAEKFADMFVSDAVKLPFIKRKTIENNVRKFTLKTSKETTESFKEPSLKCQTIKEPHLAKTTTETSEKFQDGNTVHFKYSDFILRNMDRSTTSKDKRLIAK